MGNRLSLPTAYVRLLRNRNFLLFLLNCALGSLGQGMTYISMAWLSQHQGASLGTMALVMLGFWAPSVLGALPIGAFIDRGHDRLAAFMANGMRGVALLLVIAWYQELVFNQWELFLIASTLGIFNAFYSPAIGVLIRKIVDKNDLLYANSLGDGVVEFFCIIGMGSCGFILNAIGQRSTMFLSGILFVTAAWCFVLFRQPQIATTTTQEESLKPLVWNDLARIPSLLATYTMSGILFFLMMSLPVLLAPYIKTLPTGSLENFSLLEASFSIGAVIGAMIVPYMVSKNMTTSLYVLWASLALALLCFALYPSSLIWHLSYSVIGICIATWAVVHTEVQRLTPLHYQGRLLAYNNGVWGGLVFVTFFLSHIFGDHQMIRNLYIGCSVLALTLIIIYRMRVQAVAKKAHSHK